MPRPPELIQRRGFVELVVLRGPHLVLADVGGHEGVASGHFPQFLDHELRLDDLVGAGVLQALLARQASICCHHFSIGAGLASARARSYWALRSANYVLDVADDGHVDAHALGDRRGSMSMWMILRAFCAKWCGLPMTRSSKRARWPAARRSAASPCSPRRCRACRACPEAVVGGRHRAQAHQGVGARRAGLVHQVAQGLGGIGQDHAAARVDHGTLGVQQHLHGLL